MKLPLAATASVVLAIVLWPAQAAAQSGCGLSDPPDRVIITGGATVEAEGNESVGDLIVVDGDVNIAGLVAGDVVAIAGDVRVSGCIGGDLTTVAGRATLLPAARLEGDLIYSEERPLVAPGSEVGGEVREEDWGDIGNAPWALIGAVALWIAVSASLLVLGITLVAIFPRAAAAAYAAAESQIWLSVAMGLATVIGLPLAIGLAFVTLVGIPLAIVLGLMVVPIWALGYVTCCYVLGRRIVNEGPHPILAFLAGLGILRALALIPVVGALVWIPAVVVGIGALVVAAMDSTEAAPGSSS